MNQRSITQLLTLAFTLCVAFQTIAQSWQNKVHPSVFNGVAQRGQVDFIILVKGQADIDKADALYSKESKGDYVFNTLRDFAQTAQAGVKNLLDAEKAFHKDFWIVNAIYSRGDLALIKKIAARDDVEAIVNNPKSALSLPQDPTSTGQPEGIIKPWGISRIKADSVWDLGVRGQGVVIGGQDTGYDWTHPTLKKKYRGFKASDGSVDHNYNWFDAIHADTSRRGNPCGYDIKAPCDDNNHGTHTMGTMVGSADTIQIGVAPDAQWIAARNMDSGNGTLASYVECFQWFLAPTNLNGASPNPRMAPHVVNNSWYCSVEEGCNASNFNVLEQAVNALRASGVVVVVSNGNSGPNCSTTTGPPAFFTKSFSIGSTQSTDSISGFSSRGLVTIDGSNRMKPDVSAPGSAVYSSIPGGGYATYSGTSMAGPHVAGTVALMISANAQLAGQVDTIEAILKQTAKPLTSSQSCNGASGSLIPNPTYGFGRIDALAAVRRALAYKKPTTGVSDITAQVKIYPNPFNSEFTIYTEGLAGETLIQIFNANGQVVSQQKANFAPRQTFNVSLSGEAAGVYFYRIQNSQSILSGKLVKN